MSRAKPSSTVFLLPLLSLLSGCVVPSPAPPIGGEAPAGPSNGTTGPVVNSTTLDQQYGIPAESDKTPISFELSYTVPNGMVAKIVKSMSGPPPGLRTLTQPEGQPNGPYTIKFCLASTLFQGRKPLAVDSAGINDIALASAIKALWEGRFNTAAHGMAPMPASTQDGNNSPVDANSGLADVGDDKAVTFTLNYALAAGSAAQIIHAMSGPPPGLIRYLVSTNTYKLSFPDPTFHPAHILYDDLAIASAVKALWEGQFNAAAQAKHPLQHGRAIPCSSG